MRMLAHIYHFAMITGAAGAILFGLFHALRCLINGSDFFYVACFTAMAIVAYKLMWAPTLTKYHEFKSTLKETDNE